jgi:rod shape-determining protein MreD
MAAQIETTRRSLEPQYLLLPVNPWFMWGTLLIALALNLLPWGRVAWLPDCVAIVLVFWCVHQPRRIGMGAAFVLGLLMDVHGGSLLGQHALAYSMLCYFAIAIHRRLVWFTVGAQALHVLPLFTAAHASTAAIRLLADGLWPGWGYLLAPIIEMVLWPVVSFILLAPQRRPPDRDENRPVL